ncbi:MAG: hypothetical protein L0229_04995 [Blastocatellia bacterium]|nr:hypothetical protein [Blastocatellia bacterium]
MLNANRVEYLLIGGYAVGYHGYPRATVDMDVWVSIHPDNAEKVVRVLTEFGFHSPELTDSLFLEADRIVRMGLPPLRIEVTTTISGVDFEECFANRIIDNIDGVMVNLISLEHLKINKKATGRAKDINDLEHLP